MIAPRSAPEPAYAGQGSLGLEKGAGKVVEVEAQITGNVWKIEKAVGDVVKEEDVLLIIESMKMEIPVEAPEAGKIAEIRVAEGDSIEEGDIVVVLE